jgi:alkylhydroperoxidase family enzyme
MARINVPEGPGSEKERQWQIDPALGEPAVDLARAIYTENNLPIRVHEACRIIIGHCNQCPSCMALRQQAGVKAGLTEEFYEAIVNDRHNEQIFDKPERLAMEYTWRFCYDHLSITDELFEDLKEVFTDVELFDLCVTVARHLGFGRMNQVLMWNKTCDVHYTTPYALASA